MSSSGSSNASGASEQWPRRADGRRGASSPPSCPRRPASARGGPCRSMSVGGGSCWPMFGPAAARGGTCRPGGDPWRSVAARLGRRACGPAAPAGREPGRALARGSAGTPSPTRHALTPRAMRRKRLVAKEADRAVVADGAGRSARRSVAADRMARSRVSPQPAAQDLRPPRVAGSRRPTAGSRRPMAGYRRPLAGSRRSMAVIAALHGAERDGGACVTGGAVRCARPGRARMRPAEPGRRARA